MQEIHSGLSEYICVLDGKDKAVDGNKMEFYFCERNNGQGCLGTNYLKPKRGLGAFQEFLIRFRSLYGENAYLCDGWNEYFSTVYDNYSSNILIIRRGNKDIILLSDSLTLFQYVV